jgi:CheY-like chemotaxis protein
MMVASQPVLLLVEDDPADARLLQRALAKIEMGARVIHLSDGDEAVAYFAGEGKYANRDEYPLPWLVLLDIKMPRRSGLEVLQWIREQKGDMSATPVIIFSSSSHGMDINSAYHYGANSYLVKPETTHQLESMLNLVKSYWFLASHLPHVRSAAR